MRELVKSYVQTISLSFTLIWVVLAVCNIIGGGREDLISLVVLQMIGLLIMLVTVNRLVWMIPVRKSVYGYLLSGTIQCLVVLVFGVICRWFSLHLLVLLDKVILFTIIYTGLCLYHYTMHKKEADYINRLLKLKR